MKKIIALQLLIASLLLSMPPTAAARTAPTDPMDNGCYHFRSGPQPGGRTRCGCYTIYQVLEPLTGTPVWSLNICISVSMHTLQATATV